jgi:pimeloyl-ACP methyl ester carboxylesterase
MQESFKPWNWFKREPISIEIDKPTIKHIVIEESAPRPSIVLIHGAYQSSVSFEYMRHALPSFQYINIEWSATGGFHNNLEEMVNALKDSGPVYIVGHSMGSIYAAHLSQHLNCIGGAALSAPWGGSKTADWVKYMASGHPLYKEVGTKSPIIADAKNFKLTGTWGNYVSTEGNVPGMGENNDCVLTIDSMLARKDIHTKFIKATHYEILMNAELIHSVGEGYLLASEKYQKKP